MQEYDLIISGGHVVDGSGNPWFLGDVAVRGDRIVRITPAGLLRDVVAKERIDARGLVVAPGFIDIQGASQGPLLAGDGRVISHVGQGITTEIMGEGWTAAPSNAKTLESMQSLGRAGAVSRFDGAHGFDVWLRAMEERLGVRLPERPPQGVFTPRATYPVPQAPELRLGVVSFHAEVG